MGHFKVIEHFGSMTCACSVSVRVRPLSEHEADKGSAWKIDSNKLLPSGQGSSSDTTYTLDNVFGSDYTTQAVYAHTTEDIIKKAGISLSILRVH